MSYLLVMAKKILGTKTTKYGIETRISCERCAGTGSISQATYRVCYKCGGYGEYSQDTADSAYARKLEHIAEVKKEIEAETAALERATLKNRPASMRIAQEHLDSAKANLWRLENELATMKKS